jgi:hypothetical protein
MLQTNNMLPKIRSSGNHRNFDAVSKSLDVGAILKKEKSVAIKGNLLNNAVRSREGRNNNNNNTNL